MVCVYILFSSATNKFYIGSSRNGNALIRLAAHNSGETKSTKYGKPRSVIFEEKLETYLETYTEARKKENFLKSGVRREWIKENFGNLKK
ncbi:MAG: hypothetical protein UY17_C0022G0003 [Candidatus Beckwithbacteria bacterium GW2011_GWC2_47_9]|uniref:GIY-YIG domain-containing protein n=1 Tax=Candidatus Beckwithbacteria bacterium GW2011_GWC2_47_9 TaxID=1618373 RepID=A0A0G1TZR0_9BACT|nr:MAG: hypothetical protein UX94_C0011G0003 [Parcubacteria group bacterium GW2011_GWA2_47_21]KKU87289.1 MAG: hypothetical protein UY17_C0022G0003 [Candidatus Beckwithbacteria bacterium GW2011_GWC2_47_9]